MKNPTIQAEIKGIEQQISLKESYLKECKLFGEAYFKTLADVRHLKVRLQNKKLQAIHWGMDGKVQQPVQLPHKMGLQLKHARHF